MTTQVLNVPVGAPQLFRPGPIPYSLYAQPGATGTVLIETSQDSGTTFVASPNGASPTGAGYSVGGFGGQGTILRVTASTVAATAIFGDMSYPQGGMNIGISGAAVINSSVALNTPNSTSELTIFSCRFAAGLLKLNFRVEADLLFSAQNTANAKTIKCYIGNAANNGATAPSDGGTVAGTQVLTSSSGGRMAFAFGGRNDGVTLIASSIGAALGYGISTTANITVSSNAVYAGSSAVDQALTITSTKATGAETLSLDSVLIRLYNQ